MKTILFLHGFGQSASIFEAKVGALRKDLQRLNIKTLFIQAPHALKSGDGFAWWNASDDRLVYHGLNESIELLKKRHAEEAFDGIFGFSQGAAMASYIAGTLEPQPAFLIVCGGFVCRPNEMLSGIANFRGTSLHIVGQSDQIVDPATSLNLFNILPNPKSLLEHPHGHVVPLQATNRKRMVDWIKSVL